MKTQVAATSKQAFRGLINSNLPDREREVMALFTGYDVELSRKQIWKQLCAQQGDRAPGEGGTCGRVNALVNVKKLLVSRGERIDPTTGKPQELLGLPVANQLQLFS
ncbi:hypothetical protein ACIPF8_19090 [Collimonas sp. NPDC087041]|uniref:hypothetical protein n=1 Tax=Collimonas sp. NPDC087041 TaxID=3363960 RepID=UPI0038267534